MRCNVVELFVYSHPSALSLLQATILPQQLGGSVCSTSVHCVFQAFHRSFVVFFSVFFLRNIPLTLSRLAVRKRCACHEKCVGTGRGCVCGCVRACRRACVPARPGLTSCSCPNCQVTRVSSSLDAFNLFSRASVPLRFVTGTW